MSSGHFFKVKLKTLFTAYCMKRLSHMFQMKCWQLSHSTSGSSPNFVISEMTTPSLSKSLTAFFLLCVNALGAALGALGSGTSLKQSKKR
jgi:hypothetical protein